jgi:EmrB/QacA subfamily drug resistance transporter
MAYKWRVLMAVCFGSYMATMDFSIVNVALPTLSIEFDRPADTVVWVALASSIMVTGVTLTAGRAGDLWGRKRIYLAGWVIFTVGMALGSLAQSIEQLIAFRLFQSLGVAMAIANGNALVTAAFPDQERGRALGMTSSVVGAGLMTGPVLGGVILSALDWRALFYLRVPIGVIALVTGLLAIRETAGHDGPRKLDVPGAIFIFLALGSTLLAVNRGQTVGWGSPFILGLFAVGAASLGLFLRIESRVSSPVVSLAVFRVRSFAVSTASLALNFAGQASVTFLMPFYFVTVRHFSTAHAGLIITTVPCMMLLLSPPSGYLADRFAFRYQPVLGVAMVSLGLLSLSTIQLDTSTPLIVARLALVGIGTAIFMSPNSSAIMGSVPRSMLGTASASVATSRNIGNATGLAMASAILVGVASASAGLGGVRAKDLPADALLDGIHAAFLAAACVSTLAIVASLLRGRRAAVSHTTVVSVQAPAAEPAEAGAGGR